MNLLKWSISSYTIKNQIIFIMWWSPDFFYFGRDRVQENNTGPKSMKPPFSWRVQHLKPWPGQAGQAGFTLSPSPTGDNPTRWCDVRENSWLSHFAALSAYAVGQLNSRLVWWESLTPLYVLIWVTKICDTVTVSFSN